MFIAGLILSIFGGVLLWASAMGLSCSKTKDEISAGEALDVFVLGGVITFFRDLFAAISEGIRDRSLSAFPLIVLFSVSIMLIISGITLLTFADA